MMYVNIRQQYNFSFSNHMKKYTEEKKRNAGKCCIATNTVNSSKLYLVSI